MLDNDDSESKASLITSATEQDLIASIENISGDLTSQILQDKDITCLRDLTQGLGISIQSADLSDIAKNALYKAIHGFVEYSTSHRNCPDALYIPSELDQSCNVDFDEPLGETSSVLNVLEKKTLLATIHKLLAKVDGMYETVGGLKGDLLEKVTEKEKEIELLKSKIDSLEFKLSVLDNIVEEKGSQRDLKHWESGNFEYHDEMTHSNENISSS